MERIFIEPDPETHEVLLPASIDDPSLPDHRISVRPLDFIEWPNPYRGTLIIDLEDVPVRPHRQIIPPGGTGRVMVWADAREGEYKYNLTLVRESGPTTTVDPYIDVEEDGPRAGKN